MPDPRYDALIDQAVHRIEQNLLASTPRVAARVAAWMRQLANSDDPADYFKHPRAFAFLLIPWLVENVVNGQPDIAFQSDLAYASANGYYFIRLFDNIMDDDAPLEKQILPATAFFYLEIQKTFQRHFPPDHAFWDIFETAWLQQSEATILDEGNSLLSYAEFKEIVAKKICGAIIPLAAVCHYHGRPNLIAPWTEFLDRLGEWHLMQQDLFDWHKDLAQQKRTYFLSEAEMRRSPEEPIAGWILREGLEWGTETLQAWMEEIITLARGLSCPPLVHYLEQRQAILIEQMAQMRAGLQLLSALSDAEPTAAELAAWKA